MSQEPSYRFMTIPNLLSLFRILLILPIAFYVWHDRLSAVLILIVISIVSDYLDGIIARRYNQISEWGKILDPLADKLAIGVMLIILYLKQQVPLWLVIIVIGRDVGIVLMGLIMAKKYRFITTSNFIGKATANVLAFMVVCYIFNIEHIEKPLTCLAIFMVMLSSYSYLKNFINLQRITKISV